MMARYVDDITRAVIDGALLRRHTRIARAFIQFTHGVIVAAFTEPEAIILAMMMPLWSHA